MAAGGVRRVTRPRQAFLRPRAGRRQNGSGPRDHGLPDLALRRHVERPAGTVSGRDLEKRRYRESQRGQADRRVEVGRRSDDREARDGRREKRSVHLRAAAHRAQPHLAAEDRSALLAPPPRLRRRRRRASGRARWSRRDAEGQGLPGGPAVRRKLCAIAAAVIALSGTFDRPEGPYYGLHYTWTVLADGTSWWKHVEFLADDSLQGRETGSPGHRRAAEYVVSEFRKSGLEPAGTNGFIQTVAFKTRRIDEAHSSLSLTRYGRN